MSSESATAAADQITEAFNRTTGLARAARTAGKREQALLHFREALAMQPAHSGVPIDIAIELRELGRFEEAEQHLQKLLGERPDWFEAHAERGRLARKWRRPADALAHFETALQLKPQHEGIAIDRAIQLRELGRLDESQAQLQAVLATNPIQLNAHIELARLARKRGDHREALSWFRRALALKIDHPSLPIDIAISLRELERLDEAEAMLNELVQRLPSSFEARLESARLARRAGNNEQALVRFQAAQQLRPDHEPVAIALAAVLRDLGQMETADAALLSFVERWPKAFDARLESARLARRRGLHAVALERYEHALALRPEHPGLRVDIATQLRELERFEEAEKRLADADDSGSVWHQRGLIARQRDRLDEALHCYTEGIRLDPRDAQCYRALAYEQMRLGCFDDAEQTITAALQSLADTLPFEVMQAKLLRARGELEHAKALAETLLQRAPDHPELNALLIRTLIQTADFADADALLAKQLRQTRTQQLQWVQLQLNLARARYDIDAAHRHAEEWLRLAPGESSPLLMQALLYLPQGRVREGGASLKAAQAIMLAHPSPRIRAGAKTGVQVRLLREMRMNPFAERLLESAQALPLAQRPAAIASALDEEPEYTASAISLLLSLRQLGALDASARHPGTSGLAIPKKIVQFWDAAQPAQDILDITGSWPQQCEGYAHQLFNDASAEAFLAAELGAEVVQAFRNAAHPAMRADLFRLAYLYACGGVYADADDLCRHSIEPWLDAGCELLLMQEDMGSIGNNFIAAIPKHPFIGAALEMITQYLIKRQGGSFWFVSGPGAITRIFCRLYRDRLAQQQLPAGVHIIDFYHAHQRISMHLPRRYKQSDRHWSSWDSQSKPHFNPHRQLTMRRTESGFAIEVSTPDAHPPPQRSVLQTTQRSAQVIAIPPAPAEKTKSGLFTRIKSCFGN